MATKAGKKGETTEIVRECTINLHKRLYNVSHKRHAIRAIKEIKTFAQKNMLTPVVKVDGELNKYIWSKGLRKVPVRVRVRMERKLAEDEDSAHKFYTMVTYVPVASFKNCKMLPANC
uniref:Large ribosomal subunit protein eL31 n=1 Tax=Salmo salar TaxID=8030 RepID=B5XG70_SALSA|nr:60S ribosomal protein L31 [Salmo salar]